MATSIFNVRLTQWDVVRNRMQTSKEVLNELTKGAGSLVAHEVLKKMKELLGRDKRVSGAYAPIGASGTASENLFIAVKQNVAGLVELEIMEGDRTPANYFIRSGFRGHSGDPRSVAPAGSGGGSSPVLKKLRLWAAQKGLTLKLGKSTLRYIKSKSKGGKEYGRVFSGAKESDIVLRLIRRKLWYTGSEYTNWRAYYPKNKGRFDYVAYAMKFESRYKAALLRAEGEAVTALFDYLASGKRPTLGGREWSDTEL